MHSSLLYETYKCIEDAYAQYDVYFKDGKRYRRRKKREPLFNEPKDAKNNTSLVKARLYANTAQATHKRDKSMLARGYRDSVYL